MSQYIFLLTFTGLKVVFVLLHYLVKKQLNTICGVISAVCLLIVVGACVLGMFLVVGSVYILPPNEPTEFSFTETGWLFAGDLSKPEPG